MSHILTHCIFYEKGCVEMESKPLLKVVSPVDLRDLPSSPIFHVEVQVYQELRGEPIVEEEKSEEVEDIPINSQESFINEDLLKQLQFLSRPFQQKVYQPLEIQFNDGTTLQGKIGNVQGATIQIITNHEEVLVNGSEIAGLFWQKRPFPKI